MSEREAMGKLADLLDKAKFIGVHKGNYGLHWYLSDEQKSLVSTALRAAASAVEGEAVARETIEQCAKIALDYPTPEGESDEYASGFIDASVFIRDAILASSPKQEKGTPV